jgi:NTP pyrophosphatase (non-canonical NTP hydrolase)
MNRTQEILDLLQEECAEVIQAVSKIRRFGITGDYLNGTGDQRSNLAQELADVLLLVDLLVEQGVIKQNELVSGKQAKVEKLKKWSRIYG